MSTSTIEEIVAKVKAADKTSRLYIGVDSERVQKGHEVFAKITSVVVIHHGGRHGCSVLGYVQNERIYDYKLDKPRMRLMLEVYKAAELYLALVEGTGRTDIEVHLDINPNEDAGSSIVAKEAVGYIKGMCQITPKLKPSAFAASYAADQFTSKMIF